MSTIKKGYTQSTPIEDASKLPVPKRILLGMQHLFTMFGSTILVPLLTGLDVSTVLLMGGIGTLVCHFITKWKVPTYMGSSFAFITPVILAAELFGGGEEGLAYARGGIVIAGICYAIVSVIVMVMGAERVHKLFPPVVTGSIIVALGLILAPTAVNMAKENWFLAVVGLAVVVIVSMFFKGFLQIIPVLIAMIVGFIVSVLTGNVDFTPIADASWVGLPHFMAAKFDSRAILLVAPVCVASILELFGDVAAIGETVHKDFYTDPGVGRVMLGDGVATIISASVGGCALTTYSENTGVLALTKVWDPVVMRIAAVFAIVLGFCPKLSAVLQAIPSSVVGGISIILFGFIAGTGLRTLHNVNFANTRNQVIFATILVFSLGGAVLTFHFGSAEFSLSGIALAAVISVILNLVLPKYGDEMFEEAADDTVAEAEISE